MVSQGICTRANSAWSSAITVVAKKNGEWRSCGDYRALNAVTLPDRYPIPNILDFNQGIAGAKVFATIDLKRAYNQIPVAPEDVDKTAVTTPFGSFAFLAMPFGLRNAAQTFQRFMDEVVRGLDFVYVYIDDILVASADEDEHLRHLETLFERLNTYGISINTEKSCFIGEEVDFLGFRVSSDGITPLPNKVQAIKEIPRPSNIKQLLRFLGAVNFYRACIPHAAEIQQPLYDLTADCRTPTGKFRNKELVWCEEAERAFDDTKKALADAVTLSHPDPQAELALFTDASDHAIGASLNQRVNGDWRPLGFFSRKLTPVQRSAKYSAYSRELLAIKESIKHFRSQVEGRQFVVFTDHKPLTFAFVRPHHDATEKTIRDLDYISQFTTDIRHVSGEDNAVADALSRVESICFNDFSDVAIAQQTDEELRSLIASADSSIKLVAVPLPRRHAPRQTRSVTSPTTHESSSSASSAPSLSSPASASPASASPSRPASSRAASPSASSGPPSSSASSGQTLSASSATTTHRSSPEELLLWVDAAHPSRPYLPHQFRRQAYEQIHNLAHPGAKRTLTQVSHRFVWPNMKKQVKQWAKECQACQLAKVSRHTLPHPGVFVEPDERFAHVHIDIVHLPPSEGFRYCLTAIDRFTRWPEAWPLTDMTADTVARTFFEQWICRFGCPSVVTTDQGRNFESQLVASLNKMTGTIRQRTTSYNPQANGIVERLHRTLKSSLMAAGRDRWTESLPIILLGLRASIKSGIETTPAELVFGTTLRLPGDFVGEATQPEEDPHTYVARLRDRIGMLVPTPTTNHAKTKIFVPTTLSSCSHVFVRVDRVRAPLEAPYEGPFAVIARHDNYFTVRILRKRGFADENIPLRRLKPAFMDSTCTASSLTRTQAASSSSPSLPASSATSSSHASSASSPTPASSASPSFPASSATTPTHASPVSPGASSSASTTNPSSGAVPHVTAPRTASSSRHPSSSATWSEMRTHQPPARVTVSRPSPATTASPGTSLDTSAAASSTASPAASSMNPPSSLRRSTAHHPSSSPPATLPRRSERLRIRFNSTVTTNPSHI